MPLPAHKQYLFRHINNRGCRPDSPPLSGDVVVTSDRKKVYRVAPDGSWRRQRDPEVVQANLALVEQYLINRQPALASVQGPKLIQPMNLLDSLNTPSIRKTLQKIRGR